MRFAETLREMLKESPAVSPRVRGIVSFPSVAEGVASSPRPLVS